MLKRFRVNNFKSLLNVEFVPSGINLLVGANNAGKTNLCTALRLVGLSSKQTLDAAALGAIGERWNLTNFYVKGKNEIEFEIVAILRQENNPPHDLFVQRTEKITYSYSLKLKTARSDKAAAESLSVQEEVLKASGEGMSRFTETVLLENREGQARMLHEEGFARGRPGSPFYVEAKAPVNAPCCRSFMS